MYRRSPHGERGFKFYLSGHKLAGQVSLPTRGAWIEIRKSWKSSKFGFVTKSPLSRPVYHGRGRGTRARSQRTPDRRAGDVRGGEGLEVTIKGEAKEIAALVLELQERQVEELPNYISDSLSRD